MVSLVTNKSGWFYFQKMDGTLSKDFALVSTCVTSFALL